MLFLKPKKVAGTSFEIALSVSASAQDIVTPISLEDELIRLDYQGQMPINWSRQPELESTYVSLVQQIQQLKNLDVVSDEIRTRRGLLKNLINIKGHRLYYNHIKPDQIKLNFGNDNFDNALKVTITRHPYEQIVSQAYWLSQAKHRREIPLKEIVDDLLNDPAPNTPYYFDGSQKLCDVYIKMENFETDVKKLENQIGIKIWDYLPITKKSGSGSRPKATELLSSEQKVKVQQRSTLEFELFEYDPS